MRRGVVISLERRRRQKEMQEILRLIRLFVAAEQAMERGDTDDRRQEPAGRPKG